MPKVWWVVTAWAWRFVTVRLVIIKLVRWLPGRAGEWLAFNTPLMLAMTELAANSGDPEFARMTYSAWNERFKTNAE